MSNFRIIPSLLIKNRGIYKGVQFKNHTYVGDPVNTVKLFNDLHADELILFDICCSINKNEPDYQYLQTILKHSFIPVAYGGGVNSIEQASKLFTLGIDRIVLHSALFNNLSVISEIANVYGSQSVVACINVKKDHSVWYNQSQKTKLNIVDWAKVLQQQGVGEIIVQSIGKEGTYSGFDFELINQLSKQLEIPLIISGGASSFDDIERARNYGASGVSVGSMFVYKRPYQAVLIQYPFSKSEEQ